MNNLLYEIINEASFGKVVIDGDDFQIAFNTIIYDNNKEVFNNLQDNNYPSLIIKNKNIFLEKLTKYIKLFFRHGRKTPNFSKNVERNKIKLIISFIFANATTEDFLNPINLLNRNIQFLKDNTFSYLDDSIYTEELNNFLNSSIKIKNTMQSVFMETPNRIDMSFIKNIEGLNVEYILPSISYGIVEENNEKVCYIYTLLHPKVKKPKNPIQEKYDKKISREMYKINSGVSENESEEYKTYNNQNDYYPENISDVSPSAVLSLVIFISLLFKENITRIKAVPYLPIRFLARDISINDNERKSKINEMQERNIIIQRNITDKFIRTFRRVSYHFSNFNINYFPYEINEYMEISLSNFDSHFNNDVLEDIYTTTFNSLSNKKIK